MDNFDTAEIVYTVETAPHKIMEEVSWFKKKFMKKLEIEWADFKNKLKQKKYILK